MIDYTKEAFKKIANDFYKLKFVVDITAQVAYIAYLIYALIAPTGNLIANIVLLSLSVAYFIFFLIISTGNIDKAKKRARKLAKKIFKRSKLAVKAFTLGISVYALFSTAKALKPFALIVTVFMLVVWVLQVIFDIVFYIIETRIGLLVAGVEADLEVVTKPVKTVGNFFKKISGKEIEPEKEPTKQRLWLNKKVKQTKEEKRREKEAKKGMKYYDPVSRETDEPSQISEERVEVFEDNAVEETAITTQKTSFWRRKNK